jgi:hypothetical protein
MTTLRIFVCLCVCVNYYFFFFLSIPRVLMALGTECAREDYMNGSISITASIRQKKKYVVTTDMINCSSPSVSPFLLIHMSPFVLVFPYLKWIRIDFLSLSLVLVSICLSNVLVTTVVVLVYS